MVRVRVSNVQGPDAWREEGPGRVNHGINAYAAGGPLTPMPAVVKLVRPFRARRSLPKFTDADIWAAVEQWGTQTAAARALGITNSRVSKAMRGR